MCYVVSRKRNLSDAVSLSEQQERLWTERKFTDAEVVAGDARFAVHRATLCAASPVFDAAFTSSMEEGASATYTVRDADPAAVEALLRFLYTGAACAPDAELEP